MLKYFDSPLLFCCTTNIHIYIRHDRLKTKPRHVLVCNLSKWRITPWPRWWLGLGNVQPVCCPVFFQSCKPAGSLSVLSPRHCAQTAWHRRPVGFPICTGVSRDTCRTKWHTLLGVIFSNVMVIQFTLNFWFPDTLIPGSPQECGITSGPNKPSTLWLVLSKKMFHITCYDNLTCLLRMDQLCRFQSGILRHQCDLSWKDDSSYFSSPHRWYLSVVRLVLKEFNVPHRISIKCFTTLFALLKQMTCLKAGSELWQRHCIIKPPQWKYAGCCGGKLIDHMVFCLGLWTHSLTALCYLSQK